MLKIARGILTGKCPVCHQGHIFHTFWEMNTHCPHCGINFYRESGYFTMAIFVSYGLATLITLPAIILMIVAGLNIELVVYIAIGILILFTPWNFRYGRIIWLYIDQRLDPRTIPDESEDALSLAPQKSRE